MENKIKEKDFIQIDFNLFANNKLVQTTNKELGLNSDLKTDKYEPLILIIGKSFILKALDNDLIKFNGKPNNLELEAVDAFGLRKKDLLKTFSKSSFDEKNLKPIVGVVYDFNGMYGVIKSVIGGRVFVDFNNPLAGKKIKIEYFNVKKITEIQTKINVIFEKILKIPKDLYKIYLYETKKELVLKLPKELVSNKEQLIKTIKEYILELKDFKISFD